MSFRQDLNKPLYCASRQQSLANSQLSTINAYQYNNSTNNTNNSAQNMNFSKSTWSSIAIQKPPPPPPPPAHLKPIYMVARNQK